MTSTAPPARYPVTPWSSALLYRPFVILALVLGPGVGFPMGAIIVGTFAYHVPLSAVLPPLIQVHGTVQLLGWAGCFIVGIAFHVVPRFRGGASVPFPWPQRAILVLLGGGLAVRAIAQPLTSLPGRAAALVVAGLAVGGALVLFAATMAGVLRRGSRQRRPVEHWLWLGVCGAAVTGAMHLLVTLNIAARDAAIAQVRWNGAFHAAALYAFVLPFAFGISSRAITGFLGLRPRYVTLDLVAWSAMALGAPALIAGIALEVAPLAQLGRLLTAVACLAYVASLRLFERPESPRTTGGYPRYVSYVFAAYGSLAIAASLALVSTARVVVEGGDTAPDPGLHVLTLGFVSMVIIGFAARVLPLFEGKPLSILGRHALDAAFWLLIVAVLGRLATALLVTPTWVMGLSAGAGLAGAACASSALLGVLLRRTTGTPLRDGLQVRRKTRADERTAPRSASSSILAPFVWLGAVSRRGRSPRSNCATASPFLADTAAASNSAAAVRMPATAIIVCEPPPRAASASGGACSPSWCGGRGAATAHTWSASGRLANRSHSWPQTPLPSRGQI